MPDGNPPSPSRRLTAARPTNFTLSSSLTGSVEPHGVKFELRNRAGFEPGSVVPDGTPPSLFNDSLLTNCIRIGVVVGQVPPVLSRDLSVG